MNDDMIRQVLDTVNEMDDSTVVIRILKSMGVGA